MNCRRCRLDDGEFFEIGLHYLNKMILRGHQTPIKIVVQFPWKGYIT